MVRPILGHPRLRSVARTSLRVLRTTLILVSATVAGVAIHLDLPVARRIVAQKLNSALAPVLSGTITLDRIERIALISGRVEGMNVTVRDAEGHTVIVARWASAQIRLIPLLRSLVGNGPIVVRLERVRIDCVDLTLRDDAAGVTSLANTFSPKDSSKPRPSTDPATPGRGVVVSINALTLGHTWAHGRLGAQPIDVDVDRLSASLRVDPSELSAALRPVVFHARALPIPAAAAEGSVEGAISYPLVTGRRTSARAKGRINVGEGQLDFVGVVNRGDQLAAELAAELTAKVVHLSLSESIAGAPAGLVDAEIKANASIAQSGALRALYDLRSAATTIDGQAVPAFATHGTFDGKRVAGEATIDEPGMLTSAVYVLAPEDKRPQVHGLDVDVRTEIPDLQRTRRLGKTVGGAASARLLGHLTLDEGLALEALVTASAAGLRAGQVTVSNARVTARLRGTVRSPSVQAALLASNVHTAGLWVKRAAVNVDGKVLAPRVRVTAETRDGDTLAASASVVIGPTTTVRGVDARLVRNHEQVSVRVNSARVSAAGAALDGVSIQGAGGSLKARVSAEHGRLQAKLASTAFDLARVRALVGPSLPALSGTATIDVDVVATPTGANGFARFDAKDVVLGADEHGAQVNGEVLFDGRAIALHAEANVPKLGTLVIDSDGARLGGDLLTASSYRTATGAVTATVVAELAQIAALLPEGKLPLDHVAGKAFVNLRASRREGPLPDVSVSVTTVGLDLAMKTVDGVAGPSLHGVELDVSSNLHAHAGWVALDSVASDALGELAQLHVAAKPPLGAVFSSPNGLREVLLRTEFELEASVPRRDLQRLPELVRWAGLRGNASLKLFASGTLRDPTVTVKVRANDVTLDARGAKQTRLDVGLDATFADGHGSSSAEVASGGRTVLVARGEGALRIADLVDGRADGPRWSAGGDLAVSALPLDSLPWLVGRRIGGCATGTLSLRELHKEAMLDADLHLDGFRVGQTLFRDATVKVRAGARVATLDARLVQESGELTAQGKLGIAWGSALTPSLDKSRDPEGRVRAVAFRLAPLRPLLRDYLGKVDGVLDADLRYRGRTSDRLGSHVEGEASVRDGVVDVAVLGQEFRAIQGKLTISRDGELRLLDASAEGTSGRVMVDATAHLDAFAFRDAKARVRIPRADAMSLTYEGMALGTAWGEVNVTAARNPKGVTAIKVAVPRFHLELPQAPARTTQKLEDEPTVQIGTHTDQGFVTLRREPPPKPPPSPSVGEANKPPPTTGSMIVRVALGQDVRVYRTNVIDAWLSGNVQAVVRGDRTAVSGAVQANRGFVEIRGKRFAIEHATASFDPAGAPGDPTITATAAYDAPDATRIFANYTGTAEAGKLRLYSEPALAQTEILSLIVFGTREGGDASRGNSSGAVGTAASVGGGVATQGLNKALSEITPVDITTRVDTSDSQDPRPGVAVAISSKLSASVSYRLGVPVPGQNLDRSTLRLDYRFRPRWLIETSVGDKGTSIVDLVWKRRY